MIESSIHFWSSQSRAKNRGSLPHGHQPRSMTHQPFCYLSNTFCYAIHSEGQCLVVVPTTFVAPYIVRMNAHAPVDFWQLCTCSFRNPCPSAKSAVQRISALSQTSQPHSSVTFGNR